MPLKYKLNTLFPGIISLFIMLLLPAIKADALDYGHVYLIGNATPADWNAGLADEMTPIGNNCFLWEGRLENGELKFLNRRGDWGSSIVTDAPDTEFKEGVYYSLNTGSDDNKFINKTPGYVRIIVDLGNMKVNFRRPVVALIGPAALGWTLNNVIPVFADNDGNVEWSGQLRTGELKMLAGNVNNWNPCYNAGSPNEVLSTGDHRLVYNESNLNAEGKDVDFKFLVTTPGSYTLKFGNKNEGRFSNLNVAQADAPQLTGGFRTKPGKYLAAIDRNNNKVYFGPMPTTLYLGTSPEDCVELKPEGDSQFSSEAYLKKDTGYKMASNRENWEATTLSPATDTFVSDSPTSNILPANLANYKVNQDGAYLVTADFSGSAPRLTAVRSTTTQDEILNYSLQVEVTVENGVISVTGNPRSVAIFDLAGRVLSRMNHYKAESGTYIVKADNRIFKITIL